MRILQKTGRRWLCLLAVMGLVWITLISRPYPASSEYQQNAENLEQIWDRLSDKNQARAHTAMWLLIKQLDDDSFQVREEARRKTKPSERVTREQHEFSARPLERMQ